MPMSLSAADWTRLQRRKAGNNYFVDATKARELNPNAPSILPAGTALLDPRDVGGPKTRRAASDYTNYVDSQRADYILRSQGNGLSTENGNNTGAAKLMLTRICPGGTPGVSGCVPTVLSPKLAAGQVRVAGNQRLRLN
jgi:hypothetical protein